MSNHIVKIPVFKTLRDALYCLSYKQLFLFVIVNFVYLFCFEFIQGGFSNPLSILWLFAYYVFWCVFFRYYYHKKPYLFIPNILGSLIPSTKMFFLVIVISVLLGLLPYLPLLMGFDDKYLMFFESYMYQLQNAQINILNMFILSMILMLIFPIILCRPFLAFISSVQGLNSSFKKAWKKSSGNYWQFVLIVFLLNIPCVIVYEIDTYFKCQGYLNLFFYSVFFVYYNLVFAKIYDFFYNE